MGDGLDLDAGGNAAQGAASAGGTVGDIAKAAVSGAAIGGVVATGVGLAASVATAGVAATAAGVVTAGVAATAGSGAAAAGAALGIGTALGNAIPIPGIGAAVGAIIGACVAAGEAIASAFRDTWSPSQEQAEDWIWEFAIDEVLMFLNVDKSRNAHQAARLERDLRLRAGLVPLGYLGNTGQLYNPVSNDSCENPYYCSTDPRDPRTDEYKLLVSLTALRVTATHDGRQIWQLAPNDYRTLAPSDIRMPWQARACLRFLRQHQQAIADWSEITGNADQLHAEMRALYQLARSDRPDYRFKKAAPPEYLVRFKRGPDGMPVAIVHRAAHTSAASAENEAEPPAARGPLQRSGRRWLPLAAAGGALAVVGAVALAMAPPSRPLSRTG